MELKLLVTIRDASLGLSTPEPTSLRERTTARVVAFDADQNVALLYVGRKRFHKLPGGGVEQGESVLDALRRETMEEIGCHLTNIKPLARVEEYRDRFSVHQISHCYVADVDGNKGAPAFTKDELDDHFKIVWLPLQQAIATLTKETDVEDYEGKFIHVRELAFLKEAANYR